MTCACLFDALLLQLTALILRMFFLGHAGDTAYLQGNRGLRQTNVETRGTFVKISISLVSFVGLWFGLLVGGCLVACVIGCCLR